jgi:iron complex outermembrane receptor protein
MKFRSSLLLGSIVMGLTPLSVAHAQDGIEIVTVTAAKREQNVQDVPISMNVVSQKELEKFNIADLKDFSLQVPGLVVLKTNNANTITLRGFGSSAANPAIDQTVALYQDGIFAGRARMYMAPFFDVARI